MTAPQAVSQQNPSKVAFGKVLAIQIVAYVVLVAVSYTHLTLPTTPYV